MRKGNDKNIHSARKEEHLSISLNNNIDYIEKSTGFEKYYFIHNALPEISLEEIDTSIVVLGKRLALPLMISPMVGGIDEAAKINRDLAAVAQECGIGMGTGSQRMAIEDRELAKTFNVRDSAPDILLFANLGAVQLNYGYGIKHCRKAVDMIDADALFLHLNPLQEALQAEGNYNFRDLLSKISSVCADLKKPVLVREVGFGISAEAALKLKLAGVYGIDTGGSGGTSWIEIEKTRLSLSTLKKAAQFFGDWGIPTADSVRMVRESCPDIFLVASGGIRTGIDVAKAIALGADIAGIALPVLRQVKISVKEAVSYIREIEAGLKIAMFCIGAQNIKQLKHNFNLRNAEK